MIDLVAKTALVTGGGRGIGRAITLALAGVGAKTIITYNQDIESAQETARLSPLIYPPFQLNLAALEPIDLLALRQNFGKLDIVVMNAGINRPADLDQISLEDFRAILEVNLTGQFRLIQALLPIINNEGSIIFMGSSSAFSGGPRSTHYCASKLGLVGLMQNVALFVARQGIRSNLVAPGYIQSEMASKGLEAQAVKDKVAQIPLGRLGKPEEVAGAVLWLASDLSQYVTGTIIHVSGGLVF